MNNQIANEWREQNGYNGRDGVVVIFNGDVQGWCNELPNPNSWQPGCIAIDERGNQWVATDGNPYDGATIWREQKR